MALPLKKNLIRPTPFSSVIGMSRPMSIIEREDKVAKFWLDPVRLQSSCGFSRNEIIRLQKIVGEYQIQLREAWNAYFHD
jgi:hypothetical protein